MRPLAMGTTSSRVIFFHVSVRTCCTVAPFGCTCQPQYGGAVIGDGETDRAHRVVISRAKERSGASRSPGCGRTPLRTTCATEGLAEEKWRPTVGGWLGLETGHNEPRFHTGRNPFATNQFLQDDFPYFRRIWR